MEDQSNSVTPKKGISKGLIISIIVAFLVIGGGVAAYLAVNNPSSDKHKYFLAERDSFDFVSDTLAERYSPELEWAELTREKPSESVIKLSAEYNDPFGGGGFGEFNPAEIINNSTITLTTQSDLPNKKLGVGVSAEAAGITIDDIDFYLTEEQMILGLPFLNELLQLKAADAGRLLYEVMPELTSPDEDIDFGEFFEAAEGISEEDKEYFKKEYLEMVYDKLTDDDFSSSNEKMDVNGKSIDSEKITFHLSEEKVKDIFTEVFDKLAQDDKVKKLIEEQFTNQFLGLTDESLVDNQELDQLLDDFEEGMLTAKEEFQKLSIPNGFTSTIWVDNKLIVQRELNVEIGPNPDDLVKFTINGTQLLSDENISFSYDFNFEDSFDQGTLTVMGDSVAKDDQITDSLKLSVADAEIIYESEETLNDSKREFDRVFSFSEPYSGEGSLYWSGNSTYEKDQMNAEHEFSVEATGFDRDLFTLHATIDGKQIKDVEIPEENMKDLGSMTMDEISTYIEEDAMIQFQKWFMGIMIDAGADLGF